MDDDQFSRYEQFRQLKSEIRGSVEHMIVGIDVGKDKHYAFFGTATGKSLLRRLIFENNIRGFSRLMQQVSYLQHLHQLPLVVFGLEPTGNYHKPLASWLLDQAQMLVLVSSKSIRDNRETLDGRWDKNDTKDSANVADLISQGKCQFYEQADENLIELRELLVLRKRLKKEEQRLRLQIRNDFVTKYFPELDRQWGRCPQENLAIVRWCLDPREITAMSFDQFFQKVTSRTHGLKQERRLRTIYEAAGNSVGCPVGRAAQYAAQVAVVRLLDIREQLSITMQHIEKMGLRFSAYYLLLTIPGFGPYVSALVLSVIGDPHRFSSRKQIIRLAGLDLNAKRSGKRSQLAVPVISKRGNADLRYALYQAALIGAIHDDQLKALFHRYIDGRQKERGIKTKVRVKLAAKMLVVAWTMMKTDTAFDPNRLRG
jgi:transposase